MKPERSISACPSGNVVVVTRYGPGETVAREYTQVGTSVYLLQDVAPGLPTRVQIGPNGKLLAIGRYETLEQALVRMFDEIDSKQGWFRMAAKGLVLALIGAAAGLAVGYRFIG